VCSDGVVRSVQVLHLSCLLFMFTVCVCGAHCGAVGNPLLVFAFTFVLPNVYCLRLCFEVSKLWGHNSRILPGLVASGAASRVRHQGMMMYDV